MTPYVSTTLLRTQTDERLVELIAAGHERAFDAIVDRYRRPLLRYAARFCKEDGRAEDVVQAALVSAWAALSTGTTVRDLRPWLYRIVHNGALNAMKKPGGDDAPLIEASDTRLGPEAALEQREDVRQALSTIAGLPERQRAALLAVALEGRSHADVGEDLGINDTAVRQLVSRARASLRVAATAITPWPVAVWIAGIGGPQAVDAATRAGEVAGGIGAGALFGGSAMKAGAIIAATGAVAVGAPTVVHVAKNDSRPAIASPASARTSGDDSGAGAGSVLPVAVERSGESGGGAGSRSGSGPSDSGGDSGSSDRGGSGGDDRAASGPGPGPGPGDGSADGAPDASSDDSGVGDDRSGSGEPRSDGRHRSGRGRDRTRSGDESADDAPASDERTRSGDSDESGKSGSGDDDSTPEPAETHEDEGGRSGKRGSDSGDRHGGADEGPETVTLPQSEPQQP